MWGRHSKFLTHWLQCPKEIFEESIKEASLSKNESKLYGSWHDFTLNENWCCFNLFTSWYFDSEEDDLTPKIHKNNLNENGIGVIDFMNVKK